MRDGGRRLDDEAFAPLVRCLVDGGIDGLLACGTTGEGVLLSVDERRRVAESFLAARPDGFQVAIHAGAQTTSDTVALAAHALEVGADAVAVIAPPYFPLDDEELTRHFVQVASARDPLPFYLYEFAARSGYAIPTEVDRSRAGAFAEPARVEGLRHAVPGRRAVPGGGGLDVFIGNEPLVLEGMERGAVGAVSGLASAFPSITAALVHERSAHAYDRGRCGSGPPCRRIRPRGDEGSPGRERRAQARPTSGRRFEVSTDDERSTVLSLAQEIDD